MSRSPMNPTTEPSGVTDRHSTDVVIEKETNGTRDFILGPYGDDALTSDQISNVHFEPPDIQGIFVVYSLAFGHVPSPSVVRVDEP